MRPPAAHTSSCLCPQQHRHVTWSLRGTPRSADAVGASGQGARRRRLQGPSTVDVCCLSPEHGTSHAWLAPRPRALSPPGLDCLSPPRGPVSAASVSATFGPASSPGHGAPAFLKSLEPRAKHHYCWWWFCRGRLQAWGTRQAPPLHSPGSPAGPFRGEQAVGTQG